MVKRKARALTKSTKQTGSSNLAIDRKRKALAPGKRRSKNGKIYYENRKNRSDVKGVDAPLRKKRKVVKIINKSMTLTAERKKRVLAQYKSNENRNAHTENAVMLIRLFGTKPQLAKALKISKAHLKRGHILQSEQKWLRKFGHVHYKKVLPKTVMSSERRKRITQSVKKLDRKLKAIKKNPIKRKPTPKSNPAVAKEIMRQLGKGTLFMLGANRFVSDGNSLIFFIKGSRKINRIKITLNGRDLYDLEFWKQSPTKFTVKVVSKSNDIFFDMLREVIARHTGLSTTMPRVRFS